MTEQRRAVVLGARGMLGTDLVAELRSRGWQIVGFDVDDLDITDPVQVAPLASGKFGGESAWCVNCAAYTAVDQAEAEPDAAYRVNALGAGYVASSCRTGGLRMLHVSTDFVFDGASAEPYAEDATTNPLSVYGRTKLAGEEAVVEALPSALVVRTAWLYGPAGKCFPKAILAAWRGARALRVIADQRGNPTYTGDLSRVLVDLMERQAHGGVYHASGPDTMSWHGFAELVLATCPEVADAPAVEPIRTEGWTTAARRPASSALSFAKCAALGIEPMRPTAEALAEFWSRMS